MELANYYSVTDNSVQFTQEQASAFAKGMAGDFNPIHDPGNKRFCVPGDLLFCVLLSRYGVARTTAVEFTGMLNSQSRMCLPESVGPSTHIVDAGDKELLKLSMTDDRFTQPEFVSALSQAYVGFSGQTFPDILVPLMQGAGVMINPARPMVIYKDMTIELTSSLTPAWLSEQSSLAVSLELSADTSISVNGRKGAVRLCFDIMLAGSRIGTGNKNMVLSGLREFEEESLQQIVEQYNLWRKDYAQQ